MHRTSSQETSVIYTIPQQSTWTRFFKSFIKWHSNRLSFKIPPRQEAKKFSAENAVTLKTHFAVLEQLIQDNKIDSVRIWNLDETSGFLGKDVSGRTRRRCAVRRNFPGDVRLFEWNDVRRATILPIVSGRGDSGPLLYVFKGKRLPYRSIIVDRQIGVETYASPLPHCAVMAMGEENGSVDSMNFIKWAEVFVDFVKGLTAENRKLLLGYDGY